MTVEIDDRVASGAPRDAMRAVVEHVLAAEGVGEVEVGVVLVDAPSMQALNAEHRGLDTPTDVLSFPIDEDDELPGVDRMLGDVVICVPVLIAQAEEHGVAAADELADLLVHGTLHLLGYDHESDDGEMLARQDLLVEAAAPIVWSLAR